MLSAIEFYPLDTTLTVVLWIEAILYLGIGIFELFDDFLQKPQPWMVLDGKVNAYLQLQHKIGHKMHAGLCVVLGFIALNGAIEGQVTRFELELIFISFAVLMPVILSCLPPGRLGITVLLTKPEFWLQLTMLSLFSHLVRPEIVAICIALNAWGILVYARLARRQLQPFTYETLRRDVVRAAGEETALRFDKLAGYTPPEQTRDAAL